ncbi:hypothetical protein ACQKKG_04035 [Brevundimonas sp. NPDC003935]|uniref:hypothetical protein n=1 Tax=unclassified Brevundimonas TaxID=2622653 RepID=UPI00289955D4|nr:hypothetical protein [Brevundimonas sp.]
MKKTRFAAVAALTGLLALTACDRAAQSPEAPAASKSAAFKHDLPEDVSGYYLPTEEVRIDNWRLHHVFMGQVPDFIAWQGGERPAGFAPVMIEFEDMVGPPLESGNRRRLRLIPAAYDVTESRVRVQALSGGLGAVSFDGRLDQGALATARRNLGDQGVVLTGTLKVGNRTFNNVSMRWWAGD